MIPAGTSITTDTYALHHNKQICPDPFHFRPERWIVDEKISKTTAADVAWAESAFLPFLARPKKLRREEFGVYRIDDHAEEGAVLDEYG